VGVGVNSQMGLITALVRQQEGRGLHSSTFQLDVSTLCEVDLVVLVAKTAHVRLRSERV
jgi:hypothetical protein